MRQHVPNQPNPTHVLVGGPVDHVEWARLEVSQVAVLLRGKFFPATGIVDARNLPILKIMDSDGPSIHFGFHII